MKYAAIGICFALIGFVFVNTPITSSHDIFTAGPAYPQSDFTIQWSPADEIIRHAEGSDTWPMTWADDGNLYTAFADGNGFNSPTKLSLGIAKILGNPPSITGIDIPSSIESTGDQASGRKASGMLMVDGVLYMWIRNANGDGAHSQLAWSTDYGITWTEGFTFTEFGYMTFINYGQNYAGARDNYVYMVSHDNPSAYTAVNSFILMRVPKESISNRNAYEFFVEMDNADPVWSSDISSRGAVFTHTNRALRSGISYNAGIGRYLWWQQLPNRIFEPTTRFEGGFGIYEAPEPWGPWKTLYFTEDWDVGPGETGSFPTKWMFDNGTTVHLVFSGDDYLSIRKATIQNTVLSTPPSSGD